MDILIEVVFVNFVILNFFRKLFLEYKKSYFESLFFRILNIMYNVNDVFDNFKVL